MGNLGVLCYTLADPPGIFLPDSQFVFFVQILIFLPYLSHLILIFLLFLILLSVPLLLILPLSSSWMEPFRFPVGMAAPH